VIRVKFGKGDGGVQLAWLMTRGASRHAWIHGLVVIGLIHAAEAGPGGGPPGGGQAFGPPGGGYGPGFSFPPPRGSGNSQDHSDDYDYSSPRFNFSVRRKPRAEDRKDNGETGEKKAPPPNAEDDDVWRRLRTGFGLFGSGD
jgi:hypothetical protein